MRLMLKNQIMDFNKLLEDQLQIMSKEFPSGIPSMALPNGSSSDHVRPLFPAFELLINNCSSIFEKSEAIHVFLLSILTIL